MLLKRTASRGAGGAGGANVMGSLYPMAIASRPSKFLPVIFVVVVMFFIAVYRETLMLDVPTSEDGVRGGLQFRSSRDATLSSHVAATRHDPDDIDSPNLAQIDTLRGVQSEIAAETARLAVEVQLLSQSVKESAQRVNDMPEIIEVPVPKARTPTLAASNARDADLFGFGGGLGRPHTPTTSQTLQFQRVEKVDGGGEFPRPAAGSPTGAGGSDARAGKVPSGGWTRVEADVIKREAVKEAMRDAFAKYEEYAMGFDELQPLTRRGKNNFGGLGATVIDSLDTLWIMGLSDQYSRARNWVAKRLHFNKNYQASVFETTIRIVGGLVAAFDLSGDAMYLEKCTDLVNHLKPAFETKTGIPYGQINLATGKAKNPSWARGASSLAEFGTLQMEFIALSQRTGDPQWEKIAENIVERVRDVKYQGQVPRGLYPLSLNPHTGNWQNAKVSFGAMGDSWYEYLLKVWVMGGRTQALKGWNEEWEESMKAMIDKLVFKGNTPDTMYVAEYNHNHVIHKMDHLACFVGGMLVLGSEGSPNENLYMEVAAAVTKTCHHMYADMATGIAPEFVNFQNRNMYAGARYNIQRPEAIEAIFYMFRKTGDPVYREWAWEMFNSMVKHYKTPTGWVGLKDVRVNPPQKDNTMQSFFLAETLKYFYLIFCDSDVINLDEWVFNTEAHPLKVVKRDSSMVKSRIKIEPNT